MSKNLLRPEHRAFAEQLYVVQGFPPRDVATELRERFNVQVRPAQLRQFFSRSGLSQKKAEVDRQVYGAVAATPAAAIAATRAAGPQEQLQIWTKALAGIADKALEMAKTSNRPRDLSAAAAAMTNAIRMFRSCAGLEEGPRPPVTFDFNFGTRDIPRAAPAVSNSGTP